MVLYLLELIFLMCNFNILSIKGILNKVFDEREKKNKNKEWIFKSELIIICKFIKIDK